MDNLVSILFSEDPDSLDEPTRIALTHLKTKLFRDKLLYGNLNVPLQSLEPTTRDAEIRRALRTLQEANDMKDFPNIKTLEVPFLFSLIERIEASTANDLKKGLHPTHVVLISKEGSVAVLDRSIKQTIHVKVITYQTANAVPFYDPKEIDPPLIDQFIDLRYPICDRIQKLAAKGFVRIDYIIPPFRLPKKEDDLLGIEKRLNRHDPNDLEPIEILAIGRTVKEYIDPKKYTTPGSLKAFERYRKVESVKDDSFAHKMGVEVGYEFRTFLEANVNRRQVFRSLGNID